MAAGRYGVARQKLRELPKSRFRSSEIAYQLGLCEEHLGHLDAALNLWSMIPPNSALFIKSAIGRALILMNTGRVFGSRGPFDNAPA